MIDHCKYIIRKLTDQASRGRITIGDEELGYWGYFIRFNIQFEGENKVVSKYPIFEVNNNKLFFKRLSEYLVLARKFYKNDQSYFSLSDNSFDEKLIMDILINANNYDMQNIENYIYQRSQMLKQNLECEQTKVGEYNGLDIFIEIKKNKSNLEGPYKFLLYFQDKEKDKFILPNITFGLDNNSCYIYAVQTTKKKQENKLSKQLDRHFRKLNKGVDMEDIVSNISTNALVSLTVFIEYLKSLNVTNLFAPNFMPIRYHSNKVAGYFVRKNKDMFKEFLMEHDRNQYNITNKLMHLIMRYNYHFPTNNYDYDEIRQSISLNITNSVSKSDNIIYELQNSVLNNELTI